MSSPLFSELESPQDWDFRDADTKEGTHVIHSYPAMMIPQLARGLILRLRRQRSEAATLLDPFCGAGTVLVEAARQGLSAWGNDLNPLALGIARTRTTPIDESQVDREISSLLDRLTVSRLVAWDGLLPDFAGRDYWFKPEVARALGFIRDALSFLQQPEMQGLARAAYTETVRQVSNTRKTEFKLYRLAPHHLAQFQPDTLGIFHKLLLRYREGIGQFNAELRRPAHQPRVVLGDARDLGQVPDRHFDLMVTSPPYGDSRTTVAYGQYSRLALEWLGLPPEEARTVDGRLLGGKMDGSQAAVVPSAAAVAGIEAIRAASAERAREVSQFYLDLNQAVAAIARKLKPGALCAWVVANRTVKGVVLPTNAIVAELSSVHGFDLVEDLNRNIPMKRMPSANSPSNVAGERGQTMTKEHMVILRYGGA